MIVINSDKDLQNISKDIMNTNIFYKLKFIYRLPGYRCTISIDEIYDDLFISFENFSESRGIKPFQLKWFQDIGTFVKISNRFGFIREFYSTNQTGIYLERPNNFEIINENLLIAELLNTNNKNYIKVKYGLK